MPFKLGMPISMTTTSGFSFPAMATASRPSLASPTTVRSGCPSLGILIGGGLRNEMLHSLVVALYGEPKSGQRARTLRQRTSSRQFLSAHFGEKADNQNAGHKQERQQKYGNAEEQPAQPAGGWSGFPPDAGVRALT